MPKFQPIAEYPDRFVLSDDGGNQQVVARAALSPAMQSEFSTTLNERLAPPQGAPTPLEAAKGSTELPSLTDTTTLDAPVDDKVNFKMLPGAAAPKQPNVNPNATAPALTGEAIGAPTVATGQSVMQQPTITDYGYGTAVKKEAKAVKEGAEVAAQGYLDAAKVYEEQQKFHSDLQANQNKIRADAEKYYQEHVGKVDKLFEESRATVNPNQFWAKKSLGSKIGAVLAVAMSGFAQGFGKLNSNAAMDIIDGAVREDIEAQKANISSKRQSATDAANLLQVNMARFKDREMAEQATYIQYLENSKARLQGIASATQSVQQKSAAEQLSAQLDQKIAGFRATLDQKAAENSARRAEAESNFIPGLGLSRDPKVTEEVRQKWDRYQNFTTGMAELKRMRKTLGAKVWPSDDIAKAKNIASNLKALLMGSGILKGNERLAKELEKQIPSNPVGIGHYMAILEQSQKNMDTDTDNYMRSRVYGWNGLPKSDDVTPY